MEMLYFEKRKQLEGYFKWAIENDGIIPEQINYRGLMLKLLPHARASYCGNGEFCITYKSLGSYMLDVIFQVAVFLPDHRLKPALYYSKMEMSEIIYPEKKEYYVE